MLHATCFTVYKQALCLVEQTHAMNRWNRFLGRQLRVGNMMSLQQRRHFADLLLLGNRKEL